MSYSHLRLAVIVGSVRSGRLGPTVAKWFLGEAELHEDFIVDLVDLAADSPPSFTAQPLEDLASRLDTADAFIVVTPEYNHSYPAALKNVIDWHTTQFQAKPVAFVSYGGRSGGLRAVEHLRPVFAELHAVTTRDTISFHNVWEHFDGNGQLKQPHGPATAARRLLDQVSWWARALKNAKVTAPYLN